MNSAEHGQVLKATLDLPLSGSLPLGAPHSVRLPIALPLPGPCLKSSPSGFTDKSPINDSTNVFLSLDSEQTVRSGYNTVSPTLVIRCSEGKTNAYITWDLYLGLESTSLLTRLDKEPAVTTTWTISTDNKSVFVSGSDVTFAKQLMSHQTLLAQITPYGESPVMTTFDVGGFSDAIKPLREACKW